MWRGEAIAKSPRGAIEMARKYHGIIKYHRVRHDTKREYITEYDLFLESRSKKVSKFEDLRGAIHNEAYAANDKNIEQTADMLGINKYIEV